MEFDGVGQKSEERREVLKRAFSLNVLLECVCQHIVRLLVPELCEYHICSHLLAQFDSYEPTEGKLERGRVQQSINLRWRYCLSRVHCERDGETDEIAWIRIRIGCKTQSARLDSHRIGVRGAVRVLGER